MTRCRFLDASASSTHIMLTFSIAITLKDAAMGRTMCFMSRSNTQSTRRAVRHHEPCHTRNETHATQTANVVVVAADGEARCVSDGAGPLPMRRSILPILAIRAIVWLAHTARYMT